MNVRPAEHGDAVEIAYIFNHFVATSHVTFEVDPVGEGEMYDRISESRSARCPFFVSEEDGDVVGFAFGKPFKPRAAYSLTAEVSIYVRPGRDGHGIGSGLFKELISSLKTAGFHAAIGGIALPNDQSVRLHEKFGFQKVAHFIEVGRKFDRWIDVGYWELIFRA